jgi:hypothetical protein
VNGASALRRWRWPWAAWEQRLLLRRPLVWRCRWPLLLAVVPLATAAAWLLAMALPARHGRVLTLGEYELVSLAVVALTALALYGWVRGLQSYPAVHLPWRQRVGAWALVVLSVMALLLPMSVFETTLSARVGGLASRAELAAHRELFGAVQWGTCLSPDAFEGLEPAVFERANAALALYGHRLLGARAQPGPCESWGQALHAWVLDDPARSTAQWARLQAQLEAIEQLGQRALLAQVTPVPAAVWRWFQTPEELAWLFGVLAALVASRLGKGALRTRLRAAPWPERAVQWLRGGRIDRRWLLRRPAAWAPQAHLFLPHTTLLLLVVAAVVLWVGGDLTGALVGVGLLWFTYAALWFVVVIDKRLPPWSSRWRAAGTITLLAAAAAVPMLLACALLGLLHPSAAERGVDAVEMVVFWVSALALQLGCLYTLAAAAWRLETLVASVTLAAAYALGAVTSGEGWQHVPFALWLAAALVLWVVRRRATAAPQAPWRWLAAGVLILLPTVGVIALLLIETASRALERGPLVSGSVLPMGVLIWSLLLLGPGWVALRTLDEARTLPARA